MTILSPNGFVLEVQMVRQGDYKLKSFNGIALPDLPVSHKEVMSWDPRILGRLLLFPNFGTAQIKSREELRKVMAATTSTFVDKNGISCKVVNAKLYREYEDPERTISDLKYDTDSELAVLLRTECPQLDVSDLK